MSMNCANLHFKFIYGEKPFATTQAVLVELVKAQNLIKRKTKIAQGRLWTLLRKIKHVLRFTTHRSKNRQAATENAPIISGFVC